MVVEDAEDRQVQRAVGASCADGPQVMDVNEPILEMPGPSSSEIAAADLAARSPYPQDGCPEVRIPFPPLVLLASTRSTHP